MRHIAQCLSEKTSCGICLPEYSKIKDYDYPLSGDYWTSTASDVANDNENAYQYTEGVVGAKLRKRTANLKNRAVRKMPGTK